MTQNMELTTENNRKKFIFKNYKRLLKNKRTLEPLKSPGVLLLRRGNKSDIYEKQRKGEIVYKHSDGSTRTITLSGKPYEISFGSDSIEMFICHEDVPFPIPQNILLTIQDMDMICDKIAYDTEMKKRKGKDLDAIGNLVIKVFIGFAVLIGALVVGYILYSMFAPPQPVVQEIVQPVVNATEKIIM